VPYRFLDGLTVADLAFEATGSTAEELFSDSWEAALRVMIEEPSALEPRVRRVVDLENDSLEYLLVDFLQELLFYKDAEGLLLRLVSCRISQADGQFHLVAEAAGEPVAPQRHSLGVDVKAVTYHHLGVERHAEGGWRATVILDV
jgi:SHS2 domain-containing protein